MNAHPTDAYPAKLHPVARRMLEAAAASGRPNAHLLPVDEARAGFESTFAALPGPELAAVADVSITARDGASIPGRWYLPEGAGSAPVVLYFHGGGWLLGSIDTHDFLTRRLAEASGCAVLSVGYRRGPEFRFPTAVNDAVDALRWVRRRTPEGVDGTRIAVAGDSAGGNIAAALAVHARDTGDRLAHQLLVYPVTTCDLDRGFDMTYEGVMLYRDEMRWHQDNYLAAADDAAHPWVGVEAADLRGVAPATVILAECDPIRPQGVLLADALRQAGVPVEQLLFEGMPHGFFGLDQLFEEGREAMGIGATRLAAALLGEAHD